MALDSGKIALDGETIKYTSTTYGNWELELSQILVIGESTNQNGPFTDDYFFCFATGPWMWREASFYAEGTEEFLKALSERLGIEIRLELISSTDFASRVLWPAGLVGKPMFRFVEVPFRSWTERIDQTYSDVVQRVLRSCKRPRWE